MGIVKAAAVQIGPVLSSREDTTLQDARLGTGFRVSPAGKSVRAGGSAPACFSGRHPREDIQ